MSVNQAKKREDEEEEKMYTIDNHFTICCTMESPKDK